MSWICFRPIDGTTLARGDMWRWIASMWVWRVTTTRYHYKGARLGCKFLDCIMREKWRWLEKLVWWREADVKENSHQNCALVTTVVAQNAETRLVVEEKLLNGCSLTISSKRLGVAQQKKWKLAGIVCGKLMHQQRQSPCEANSWHCLNSCDEGRSMQVYGLAQRVWNSS